MKIEWNTCLRVGGTALGVYLIAHYWDNLAGLAKLAVSASVPLILGCITAYILNILMSLYEARLPFDKAGKWGKALKRPVCMVLSLVSVVLVLGLVIGMIIPELMACIQLLIQQLNAGTLQKILVWLEQILQQDLLSDGALAELNKLDWNSILKTAAGWLTSGIGSTVGSVVGAVSSTFSTIVTVVMCLVFALYLLAGKESLGHQMLTLAQTYLKPGLCHKLLYVVRTADRTFRKFIVGQCLEAVVLGALCIGGMMLFRFPYATMIGTLVGFTALIPVAGAYIGAAVGAFMILTVSPVQAFLFVVFLVVLQQLEGNLIYPKVVGSSIGLPGLWVMAAVTIGGGVAGVLGMLVGVPLAATLYQLLRTDVMNRQACAAPAFEAAQPDAEENGGM